MAKASALSPPGPRLPSLRNLHRRERRFGPTAGSVFAEARLFAVLRGEGGGASGPPTVPPHIDLRAVAGRNRPERLEWHGPADRSQRARTCARIARSIPARMAHLTRVPMRLPRDQAHRKGPYGIQTALLIGLFFSMSEHGVSTTWRRDIGIWLGDRRLTFQVQTTTAEPTTLLPPAAESAPKPSSGITHAPLVAGRSAF